MAGTRSTLATARRPRAALAIATLAMTFTAPLAAQPAPPTPPPPEPPPAPAPAPAPTAPAAPPSAPPPAYGQPAPRYPQPPPAYPYPYPPYGWQPPPPAPAPPPAPPEPPNPPAREGFQMSVRIGAGVPFGKATGEEGDTQKSRYSTQLAWEIALGGKPTPSLYIGGYAGAWGGAEGDDPYARTLCREGADRDVDCDSYSSRVGAEIQWHFIPAGGVNPWIGYGLAYEWASESITDDVAGRTEESWVHGMQFGRLQAGLDIRLGKVFGLGPYVQAEFGRYVHQTTEVYGKETHSGDIENKALHGWFGTGLRLVLFP